MRLLLIFLISSMSFFLSVCEAEPDATNPPTGLHKHWMDKTVDPNNNYYKYANGHWRAHHHIPDEDSSLDIFSIIELKNAVVIRNIIETLAQNPTYQEGSEEQKIVDFYLSGIDEATINSLGIKPLQSELDQINNIKSIDDLQKVIAHLQLIGVHVPFNLEPSYDYYSNYYVADISEPGLGLPDRQYYQDKKYSSILNVYKQHIVRMFVLLGDTYEKAKIEADVVVNMETALSKSFPMGMMVGIDSLKASAPHFNWTQYFSNMGHPEIKNIRANFGLCAQVSSFMISKSLDAWKAYLRWHLIHAFGNLLSEPFVYENFLFKQQLMGVKQIAPRWERVIYNENNYLGFAIGKLFVKERFNDSIKLQVEEMSNNLRSALKITLQNLDWMSQQTKNAALNKLDKMSFHIGYPDQWPDYSGLVIERDTYLMNIIRAKEFNYKLQLNKIGKPVNKSEWVYMLPQTVNAMYNPLTNQITIPAGLLQPPLFNPTALPVVNYASYGSIVGHEIMHGYDDTGSRFNGDGILKEWWTPEDRNKFSEKVNCVSNQFSQYSAANDANGNKVLLDGSNVVGEAIADLGGLTIAYRAFHLSDAYSQATTVKGLTPDQQFFLAAAHVWASKKHPQQKLFLSTDPHPPEKYRVNGTLGNMQEFRNAFNTPSESSMVNAARCSIW